MQMQDTDKSTGMIPALWPIIGLPALAVVASILLLWQAFGSTDSELPAHYYTEGRDLEADLTRAQRALQLGVQLELVFERTGDVVADLGVAAASGYRTPASLELRVTHATLAARDRMLILQRGTDGRYRGRAAALDGGPWLVQVADSDVWRLRGRLEADTGALRMGVTAP
jgi:uncharacterized protein